MTSSAPTRFARDARTPWRRLPGIAALVLTAALLPACTSSSDDGGRAGADTDAAEHAVSEAAGEECDAELGGEEGESEAGQEAESEEGASEEGEQGQAEGEGDLLANGEIGGQGWNEDIERATECAGPEYPEDAFLFRRLMTSGSPDRDAFVQAKEQATALRTLASKTAPAVASRGWTFLGPKNVGGRLADGVVDPTSPDTIYVASATNGVWKSSDAGETFTSVWPKNITHSMGALAITPDGTLYAGTGETNPGGGSITYGGDGIYRSTNGGTSWQRVGLTSSSTIGRIVVDPTDADRIWVAVSGNLFTPGGERGIYVSSDGGDSWSRSLASPNQTTGATDVAIDPSDSDHLIATMWDHIRKPDARVYTGVGSGVWESQDGGDSWQRLGADEGLQAPSENTGRIGVAFAPSDPNRVWIIYANNETGAFENFFRSDDNGATWQRPAGANELGDSQSVYGWWFSRLFPDPDDADRLYVTGLDMWETKDGAQTFETLDGLHADQHVVMFDPDVPDRVYVGNDGGLFVSEEDDADFTQSDDQPWSQYAGLDVSEQDSSRVAGGLQDNGTQATWTAPGDDWSSIFGGDGQRALIDPKDMDNYYACSQYGNCSGFDNGSTYRMQFTSDRYPYFMQYEFDPNNSDVMYGGGNRLNKSTDGGHTWAAVTGDLGKGEAGQEPNPLYRNHYGTISTLAVAKKDSDVVYVGTDNGFFYKSTNGGTSFTELPNPVRDHLWIQRVLVDPADARTVYLTFSGYREGDNAPYVLRSRNGGQTWQNITANLPHAPVNDLAIVQGRMYAATDLGVFSSAVAKPKWFAFGSGMPQLATTDLRYVPQAKKLFVATFGMGVWSIKA
jgi:photosystem II stability/assembly factor-like uncharacterized protein